MFTFNFRTRIILRLKLTLLFILFFFVTMGFPVFETPKIVCVKEAEARAGKTSAARVQPRTKRRTHRRVTAGTRVYVLPSNCTTVRVAGVIYHRCRGVYYRPYYEGSTVVYVVETPKQD